MKRLACSVEAPGALGSNGWRSADREHQGRSRRRSAIALINCYHQFLPKKLWQEFSQLTMQNFLERKPKDRYPHPIFTDLPEDKRFVIASTTRAFARKPPCKGPLAETEFRAAADQRVESGDL